MIDVVTLNLSIEKGSHVDHCLRPPQTILTSSYQGYDSELSELTKPN